MTLHPLDLAAFILLAVVFPAWDFRKLRSASARINSGEASVRKKIYGVIIRDEWLVTTVFLAFWLLTGRGLPDLGFAWTGSTLTWIGYAAALGVCLLLVGQSLTVTRTAEGRDALRRQFGEASFLMPRTHRELTLFSGVSLTAAICEEILYRGFVVYFLTAALGTPVWLSAVVSGVIFGFIHAYQGPAGILRTATAGIVLGLVYWATGALWAPIVVHAVMDLTSGRMAFDACADENLEPAVPAAG